ncbi:MAG: maleylacetoacetate isomerase, partial [Alphaproteobacteria bacterium]|nr:maleylacetoacetate isomerase [Alphaproteobacteria bacterium]
MKLWGYFRSSAAFRTRIALGLKGLPYDNEFIHLRKAEQRSPEFLARNPQGLIPYLRDGDLGIAQSLAICEYLDEAYPDKPLLPPDIPGRARVRNLAFAIACDIHPLNNLRVLNYLSDTLKLDKAGVAAWYRHWIAVGFDALEKEFASPETGKFCHGDTPTLADVCLVPQTFNAKRFYSDSELDAAWPRLMAIFKTCMT